MGGGKEMELGELGETGRNRERGSFTRVVLYESTKIETNGNGAHVL